MEAQHESDWTLLGRGWSSPWTIFAAVVYGFAFVLLLIVIIDLREAFSGARLLLVAVLIFWIVSYRQYVGGLCELRARRGVLGIKHRARPEVFVDAKLVTMVSGAGPWLTIDIQPGKLARDRIKFWPFRGVEIETIEQVRRDAVAFADEIRDM